MRRINIKIYEACDLQDLLAMIKGLPMSVEHCRIELYEQPDDLWMSVEDFDRKLKMWCSDLIKVDFRLKWLGSDAFNCDDLETGMSVTPQELADWRAERGE
ncbi:MAG: hypothetical protein E7073_06790 [Bacteroidales bacterium]|jgi:hypothetical protein|nr:hypothetical protein [Bacteroidales bacterium]